MNNYPILGADHQPPDIFLKGLGDLSNVMVWVKFRDNPTVSTQETFATVVKSHYICGKLGGFNSGHFHIFSAGWTDLEEGKMMKYKDETAGNPACLHGLSGIEVKGRYARFFLDIGSADELSLEILLNMLIGFSRDIVPLDQVIIGGAKSERPGNYDVP